ncbi:MAG TPA: flagellar hook-basal body complex protein FliE [Burkholderiaceae bacterium]|nr:flagellar hook-basal body complex protein FliE [Burkholderiaceae bacterium]
MDVRLTPELLSTLQRTLQAGGAGAPAAAAAQAAPGTSFAAALGDALKGVSQTQQDANTLQRQFQAGVEGVSLEETMIAMQKAQIGFQAAVAVRNRLVSAYSDVMNMQV